MILKTRVTKKAITELTNIAKSKGYWSNEVKDYLSFYNYNSMCKLNNAVKSALRVY